jgi:DNA-directed RNA polymerase sigma subunit (sigma70/sigma32)
MSFLLKHRFVSNSHGWLSAAAGSTFSLLSPAASPIEQRGPPQVSPFTKGRRSYDPGRGVRFISSAVSWIRQAILRALLEQMSPREMQILRQRYGVGGCRPASLEEIGARLDMARERIRQIEKRAPACIRSEAGAGRLRPKAMV